MNRNRRSFLLTLGRGAACLPLAGILQAAADGDGERLDPQDPAAKNLNYSHQSGDASRRCQGCQFYTPSDDAWGTCVVFPGKLVSVDGVCDSWFKRAS